MNNFSIPMAIVDFIPVVFFIIAVAILNRDLHNKMSRTAFSMFATGTANVALAGLLKATHKLLYAANICDFKTLTDMFFATQAIGFMLAGLGLVLALIQKKDVIVATAPAVFSGTFLFVTIMVIGLGAMNGCLSVLAKKLNEKKAIIFFVISFVCSLLMGYLSSRDFSQSFMNWLAQGINIVSQGAFLTGVIFLHRAGLRDYRFH
ncbi:MAG TPA: hypothetical protein PLI19_00990 [Erysipelotrichaceae bacterium]|nr:hypothetical protein [Erysipelotrichaceae bacterium]HQB31881.1 hypothetical protein [Erysipelotrichaceae bacterium]